MNSEFRLCPACRAPNTVQNAACAACGAPLPRAGKAPTPTFDAIPGRQEARQAAGTGVRRGLVVGVASAAILGLLLARTFRSPALQDGTAQTASTAPAPPAPPAPVTTPEPAGMPPGGAVPVAPAGWERPNPYASPGANAAGVPQPVVPQPVMPQPVMSPAPTVPAVIIGARSGSRPSTMAEATQVRNTSKAASYTDADLARVRVEAEAGSAPPEARPATSPSPSRSPAQDEDRDARVRDRRAALRAAQQRVDNAQRSVDDIRREARDNDDDGLQEELSDALKELKSAEKDLAKARRRLQEVEDQARPVLPPQ